jgi:uncharacterized delta-60 repeat protein
MGVDAGRSGRVLAVALAAMAFGTAVAQGAIGDLDPSFAGSGVVVTQLGQGASPVSEAIDAAVQPDGRIVVSGAASDSLGHTAVALARYLPSGAFDTSFGGAGTGATIVQFGAGTMPQSIAFYSGLALQPDGKIVTCGIATDGSGNGNVLVARFTQAGTVDPSFGSAGRFVMQFGTAAMPASNLFGCTIDPNGRIVGVGGRNDSGSTGTFVLVIRLNSNGSLDPSFGSGGVFTQQLGLGATPSSVAADVVALGDGRLVFSMAATDSSGNTAMGIGRLSANGGLDPSFGNGGETVTTFPSSSPFSEGVQIALQPSGKFVVSGDGRDAMGHGAFTMARYTSSGNLDAAFGSSGLVVNQLSTAATPSSAAIGLVVQPNGKPVLLGTAVDASGNSPLTLVRYNVDGNFVDPTFGGGVVQHQFASGSMANTTPIGGTFTPSGKLIVVGAIGFTSTPSWFVSSFIADQPPTAAFTFSPSSPVVGDTITLDASASHDAEGSISAVAWDLNGDGNFGDAAGVTTTTSFTTGGTHHVSVLVADDDGLQATASADIPVGCGTAQTFLSVECRITALLAQIDAGVPPGSVHDKLHAAAGSVQTFVQQAAGAGGGKPQKKALGKAIKGVGHFIAAAHKGKHGVSSSVRNALIAAAGDIRTTLKHLRAG